MIARVVIRDLRKRLQTETAPVDGEHPGETGRIRRQPLQSELLQFLLTVDGTPKRIFVQRCAPPKFVDQGGREDVSLGGATGDILTQLIALPDGGQIMFVDPVISLLVGTAPVD